MRGLSATEDGTSVWRVSGSGAPANPEELGERLADEIRRLERTDRPSMQTLTESGR
jgi:hypothetical protein